MIMYSSQQFSYAYAHNVHIFSLGSCRNLGVFQMYTLFCVWQLIHFERHLVGLGQWEWKTIHDVTIARTKFTDELASKAWHGTYIRYVNTIKYR